MAFYPTEGVVPHGHLGEDVTRRLVVVGLAVLGIVLAAGIALAAAHLVRQPIGLASEPVSAGRRLAPEPPSSNPPAGARARVRRKASDRASRQTRRTTRSSPAGPSSPPTSAPPPSGSSQGPATGSRDDTSPGDDGAGGSGGGEGDD